MIGIGRIEWSPVYRVKHSTDPSVRPLQQPINDNAAALIQLQQQVQNLLERVQKLERELDTGGGLTESVAPPKDSFYA